MNPNWRKNGNSFTWGLSFCVWALSTCLFPISVGKIQGPTASACAKECISSSAKFLEGLWSRSQEGGPVVGELLDVNLNLSSISRTIEAGQWCWAPDYERCVFYHVLFPFVADAYRICSCLPSRSPFDPHPLRQLKQGLHVEKPLEEVQLWRPWPGCHQKNAWRRCEPACGTLLVRPGGGQKLARNATEFQG